MSKITIDLRLVDVDYELWALAEHQQALEEYLSAEKATDRKRTWARLHEQGLADDEAEIQLAFQEHEQRVEHALPRLLRGSYLVVVWAVFEAAMEEIAEHLRVGTQHQLKLKDIAGDNFLSRAEKYFTQLLRAPLTTTNEQRTNLRMLLGVRNAIAHANGRLEAVRKEQLTNITAWIADGVGLSDEHGWIMPFDEFVKRMYETVNDVLKALINRVRGK